METSAAVAAKLRQSCLTLCNPIDGSPPGSSVPGILQARTLEWVAFPSPMHESEKWKWSRSVVSDSSRPHGLQPTRLLRPWDFPSKSTGVGCHCLLHLWKLHSFSPWNPSSATNSLCDFGKVTYQLLLLLNLGNNMCIIVLLNQFHSLSTSPELCVISNRPTICRLKRHIYNQSFCSYFHILISVWTFT